MSGHELAAAVKAEARRAAVNERSIRLARVDALSPLVLETLDTRHALHEENLTFGSDFKAGLDDLAEDDVVVLARRGASYVCLTAVSDAEPLPKATQAYVDAKDAAMDVRMDAQEVGPTGPHASRTRLFAQNYQPNTTRATMVIVTLQISCTAAEGVVTLLSDSSSPPVTILAQPALRNNNAANVYSQQMLSFVVPAGHFYRLNTTTLGGAPSFSIISVMELTL